MKKNLLIVLLTASLVMACSLGGAIPISSQRVEGSGVAARESRSVSGFTSIEIAGAADAAVSFGDTESVVVETDDNILPLITTEVSGGKLVINTRSNTNFSTELGIKVTVTMKELEAAEVSGSGNMTLIGVPGGAVQVEISGSGNITAAGVADSVEVNLDGSGNILCGELQAKTAVIRLDGSGNVAVYASQSLDAAIGGSGNVQYGGDPTQLQTSVTGSGSIDPMP